MDPFKKTVRCAIAGQRVEIEVEYKRLESANRRTIDLEPCEERMELSFSGQTRNLFPANAPGKTCRRWNRCTLPETPRWRCGSSSRLTMIGPS